MNGSLSVRVSVSAYMSVFPSAYCMIDLFTLLVGCVAYLNARFSERVADCLNTLLSVFEPGCKLD